MNTNNECKAPIGKNEWTWEAEDKWHSGNEGKEKDFFSDIPLSKDRAKDALGDKDLVVTDGGGTS